MLPALDEFLHFILAIFSLSNMSAPGIIRKFTYLLHSFSHEVNPKTTQSTQNKLKWKIGILAAVTYFHSILSDRTIWRDRILTYHPHDNGGRPGPPKIGKCV